MKRQEAEDIIQQLKPYIGQVMKPYNLPVSTVILIPADEATMPGFINAISVGHAHTEMIKRYTDFSVGVLFGELNLSKGIQWCNYYQFAIANDLTI